MNENLVAPFSLAALVILTGCMRHVYVPVTYPHIYVEDKAVQDPLERQLAEALARVEELCKNKNPLRRNTRPAEDVRGAEEDVRRACAESKQAYVVLWEEKQAALAALQEAETAAKTEPKSDQFPQFPDVKSRKGRGPLDL